MNFEYLETIGKFIGTYGLAVFLVLYYAVKLYPEIQKERAEWIRQITRLRQLIDPATRTLTRDQARTVLQLASDALSDRLQLLMGDRYMEAPAYEIGNENSFNVYGAQISFDPLTEMSQNERDQEFSKIIREIDDAIKNRVRRNRDRLERTLEAVTEFSRKDAYRLALLRFSNTSLESLWEIAFKGSVEELKQSLGKTLNDFDSFKIDDVRQFIHKHPSSPTRKDEIEVLFNELRFTTRQEHATFLKNAFDRYVEKELRKLDQDMEEM